MNDQNNKVLRLGELLVQKGVTTLDQVNIALTEQKKTGEKIGKILVRLGFATEAIIRDVIGGVIGQVSISLENVVVDADAITLVTKSLARRLHILPLTYDADNKILTIAMTDTFNIVVLDQVSIQVGRDIELVPILASDADIEKAIDRFYGIELSIDGILHEIETGEIDYRSLDAESSEYSQPVVRLVNAFLCDAVKRHASDIHFEPEEGYLRFRYRIDGVLRQIRSIHKDYWPAIAVRLKVMAGMDITETRAAQDGRFSLSVSGRPVDFRVSTIPTVHGDNIVLRILDRQSSIVSLDKLGLKEEELDILKIMVSRPQGIILVTGPTGSGKTTTLYSVLRYLNNESVNIMTLEDPVEYPVSMIRQTSASESSRLDFASGIRAIMRQDPDIILVGEIRDMDTATMALRAAMTGHQVFSTLHSNSALGVIPRLVDIGLDPEILSGNIIGVIAQRLVRVLCENCREAYQAGELECRLLSLNTNDNAPTLYRAKGCMQCNGQGYKGRMAVQEILRFDSDLDEVIATHGTQQELMRTALQKGFKTLADSGTQCVLDGKTSVDEISRVIDLTARIK